MLKGLIGAFLITCFSLQASLIDWFSPFSEKADRAEKALGKIDPEIEKALKDFDVPGLGIGIVVDGQLVYGKGFGVRDLDSKAPVNTETLFPIGSCTKAFTTFLMGLLVEEGLIDWDQRVIDILPEFRLYDPYATQNLTLRDLLCHRSGMPRHDFMWYNSCLTRSEVMKRLRYLEPSCDLRERYQYNNLMYLVAGYAMETVAQMPWEELVWKKILVPLRMERTHFSVNQFQTDDNVASPYIEKEEGLKKMKFRNISLIGPGGSINSTIEDLSHWLQLQLGKGSFEGLQLMSESTLQETHAPQIVVPPSPETKDSLLSAYGMGWAISSYRGHYMLNHDGGIDGFTSVVAMLPQEKVGVVILANKNMTPLPRVLAFHILDRILGVKAEEDWLQRGIKGIEQGKASVEEKKQKDLLLRKEGTTPSHPIENFAGTYEHPGYGEVLVEVIDGKLHAHFNGIALILDHWHYDTFVVAAEGEETYFSREGIKVSFQTSLSGEIDQIVIPLEPKTADISFVRKEEIQGLSIDELRVFTGTYELQGYTVEIAIRNGALCAIAPGQPLYYLIPTGAENQFTVQSMAGYSLRFLLDDQGAVEELLLVHPYGAMSARPKSRA